MEPGPYRKLFGSPTQLGPTLATLRLGEPGGVDAELTATLGSLGLQIETDADLTAVYAARITANDASASERLIEALHAAWGAGDARDRTTEDGPERHTYWVDPAAGRRASLFTSSYAFAELETGLFVAPEVFLDAAWPWPSAFPIWAIGRDVGELRAFLGPRACDRGATSIWWSGPGIGLGTGTTQFTSTVAGAHLETVTAFAIAEPEVKGEIRERLIEILGTPAILQEHYAGWDRKVPIQLRTSRGLALVVGERLRPPDPTSLDRLLKELARRS